MGSGMICFCFLAVLASICLCLFFWTMVDLFYKSIDEYKSNKVSFWLPIVFLLVFIISMFAAEDIIEYDNKHILKISPETTLSTDHKEIKTFDIYIKNGETYLNAKNATIGQDYISFDTEDRRHLEINAETLVEVHTEIIKE